MKGGGNANLIHNRGTIKESYWLQIFKSLSLQSVYKVLDKTLINAKVCL